VLPKVEETATLLQTELVAEEDVLELAGELLLTTLLETTLLTEELEETGVEEETTELLLELEPKLLVEVVTN
jgi:hypothetical protein